jgi:hypothetical protein
MSHEPCNLHVLQYIIRLCENVEIDQVNVYLCDGYDAVALCEDAIVNNVMWLGVLFVTSIINNPKENPGKNTGSTDTTKMLYLNWTERRVLSSIV